LTRLIQIGTRDSLGPVPVPTPPVIGAFPLRPDFGGGVDYAPVIVVHTFDQPGLKTEQRYLMSPSTMRRFRFVKNHLSCTEYDDLKSHWEQAQGAYAQFPYTIYKPLPFVKPNGPIHTTETVTARYENPSVSFDYMVALLVNGPGITLLEIPQTVPSYNVSATVERFPDATLASALADQAQEIVPLIQISPRDGSTPLYLSNQHVTMTGGPYPGGGITYLPRLLDWSGISQSIGENSDACSMNFGNADGVWTTYVNQVNLYGATLAFSFYHVGSGYLVNLWQGGVINWGLDTSGKFQINVSDGTYLLSLGYPSRKILRACWKVYRGRYCPASATNGYPDCPKDFDSCTARGVPQSFGGLVVPAQAVRIKDNSTGVLGWGRSMMTSVTVSDDTIYQRPLQEIFTDEGMNVTADVASGRDESDYYAALGIVGEGPIGGYNANLILQTLDGQPPHDPLHNGGWRYATGVDPANPGDWVGITQAPWNVEPPGSTFAAGIAFAEIRRTDAKGLQLSAVSDHAMTVNVTSGMGGWVWTGPSARVWTPGLANTAWVALNVYLRAIGLRVDYSNQDQIPAWMMENYFNLNQTMAMAAICDTQVPKLIGDGNELQFPFRGVLKEVKPVRDWLREILNGALGFYTFVNGKLWIGLRVNSSVLAGNAFTQAHILHKSLVVAPMAPQFNWLVGNFGDEEFGFQLNNVTIYDIDQASFLGTADSPQYLTNTINYVGISNKSQCARVITARLREEIGGLKSGTGPHGTGSGIDEQMNARNFQFRTTLLSLQTMVGDIISLTHPSLPNSGYVEGRVTRWALNPDWSIDIQASSTTDDMYDLVAGPKPVDVSAPMVPPETLQSATGLAWLPDMVEPQVGDPIYPIWERSFKLWQEYEIATDDTWVPTVWVEGHMTVNQFGSQSQPRILEIELANGGSLNGPQTVYCAMTQRNPDELPCIPSNLVAIWIPEGLIKQQINLTVVASTDPSLTSWDLWAANDRRLMALQSSGDGPPFAKTVLEGPIENWTQGMPNAAASGLKIQAKHVYHAGVAGVLVTGVSAPNQIQCLDFKGATDNWVGQFLTIISNVNGEVPLWNFKITAFDAPSGTMTVSPNCVTYETDGVTIDPQNSIQVGDVLIVYSRCTSADSTSISNTFWDNSVTRNQFPGTSGMNPGEEVGRIVRILRGTGAGQWRYISDNDNIKLTVTPAWDTTPDTTSFFIVEAPNWLDPSETNQPIIAPTKDIAVQLHTEIPNLTDEVVLVGGYLIDTDGNQTDDQFACYRMIYIFGQPPTVRTVGPGAGPFDVQITDQVLRVDSSANDVAVTLLSLSDYQGRGLLVFNLGPNNCHITAIGTDTFPDGTQNYTIAGTGTARITAGGIYTT
jgi:hypothetical protein